MGIRERTRRAVQTELFTVAMGLFLEHGFEATTVDQIAAAAGLSRRSFFRYFASKDDVLTQALVGAGRDISIALAGRPAAETPWIALRQAFQPLVDAMTADPRALTLTGLMLQSPDLAGPAHKKRGWQQPIIAVMTLRLPAGANPDRGRLEVAALTAAALACLISAQNEWVTCSGRQPLSELVDVAMSSVAPITLPD